MPMRRAAACRIHELAASVHCQKFLMKLEIKNLQKFHPIDKREIRRIIKGVLKEEKKGEDAELSIVLMDNRGIKRINNAFLGHNYATDVLSFAYNERFPGDNRERCDSSPEKSPVFPAGRNGEKGKARLKKKPFRNGMIMGEIIVSVEMAVRCARKYGYAVEGEIALYLVHGLLHLLGYRDKREKEAKEMHGREGTLLSYFGYAVAIPD